MTTRAATIGDVCAKVRRMASKRLAARSWSCGRQELVDDLSQSVIEAALASVGPSDVDHFAAYCYSIINRFVGKLAGSLHAVSIPPAAQRMAADGRAVPMAIAAIYISNSTEISLQARADDDCAIEDIISDPEAELQDRKLDRVRALTMLSQLTPAQRNELMMAMRDDGVDAVVAMWAALWPGNKEGPTINAPASLERGVANQMAKEFGIKKTTLHYRLSRGMTLTAAAKPVRKTASLIGVRFGRTTVRSEDGRNAHGKRVLEATCDCGGTATGAAGDFKNGRITSCGCAKLERAKAMAALGTAAAAKKRNDDERVARTVWLDADEATLAERGAGRARGKTLAQ